MKQCPECNSAYETDNLKYCRYDGTLLIPLHVEESRDTTLFFPKEGTQVEEIPLQAEQQGGAKGKTLKFADVDEPVMAISINRSYRRGMTDEEVYQCTRGTWVVDRERAARAQYAFAVYQQEIKEVYEIHGWRPTGINDGRSKFDGEIAPESIRRKYREGKLPRSYGSPVRYINC